ncbi:hypothetical protein Tco_0278656 [Tanacetum coccineum]
MSKVLQEKGSGSLPSSTEMNLRDHNSKLIFKPRQATIPFPSRLYDDCYDEENGSYGLKDLDAHSIGTTLRNDTLPRKEKDPGSFTLPCYINNVCFEKAFADLGASVSVMPLLTYLNLGLGELSHTKLTVELANITVKHPKGIAENVLVGIGKFVFLIDFIILDMPEDVNVPLILGRLFLSTTHAKVDVFKRKITLRKKSSDDLEPTIEEGEVVNEPMMDIVKNRYDFIGGLDDYPSNYDFDRRIHIDFMEDMDSYLDEGMGDVIVGEPFCKASCVEARRFDGIITIRDGDDSVTYQMVRSNPRFKHLTNEKCNKIPPLFKGFAAALAVFITGASQSRQHGKSEPEVILFYNGLEVPTRQILDSKGVIPTKTAADAKTTIQEMAEYSQKWHNETSRTRSTKTSDGLAAIQAQLNNLGREIKKVNKKVYFAQVGCKLFKGPHYTKDCPLKEEGKTLEEAYYT